MRVASLNNDMTAASKRLGWGSFYNHQYRSRIINHGSLPSLSTDHVGDVYESSVVLDSLESSAFRLLWLLLLLDLWCLRLDLSGTR